jgi:hypothetical protein
LKDVSSLINLLNENQSKIATVEIHDCKFISINDLNFIYPLYVFNLQITGQILI